MRFLELVHIFTGIILSTFIQAIVFFEMHARFGSLTPFICLSASVFINFSYFYLVKVNNPKTKAVFVSLVGSIIFWGGCATVFLILAPALTNM